MFEKFLSMKFEYFQICLQFLSEWPYNTEKLRRYTNKKFATIGIKYHCDYLWTNENSKLMPARIHKWTM